LLELKGVWKRKERRWKVRLFGLKERKWKIKRKE